MLAPDLPNYDENPYARFDAEDPRSPHFQERTRFGSADDPYFPDPYA